jgi:hypothetical protein
MNDSTELHIKNIDLIKEYTEAQLKMEGESALTIFRNTTEELGEIAEAMSVEDRSATKKYKKLKEPSTYECIDLIQCGFSLYFARGGTMEEFDKIMSTKLGKWKANLDRSDGME